MVEKLTNQDYQGPPKLKYSNEGAILVWQIGSGALAFSLIVTIIIKALITPKKPVLTAKVGV